MTCLAADPSSVGLCGIPGAGSAYSGVAFVPFDLDGGGRPRCRGKSRRVTATAGHDPPGAPQRPGHARRHDRRPCPGALRPIGHPCHEPAWSCPVASRSVHTGRRSLVGSREPHED